MFQLSTKLIQEGHHEDLDWVMKAKEEEHRRHLGAVEAEMDAEEAEHAQKIADTANDDLLHEIKETHKDILTNVSYLSSLQFGELC